MDAEELHKRRDSLYMRLRYWKLHEKQHGVNAKSTAKQAAVMEELEPIRQQLKQQHQERLANQRIARETFAVEEKAEREQERQIAENKRISNQCRTTRNRSAKWRASTIYYDPNAPKEEWNPSFTVDLAR